MIFHLQLGSLVWGWKDRQPGSVYENYMTRHHLSALLLLGEKDAEISSKNTSDSCLSLALCSGVIYVINLHNFMIKSSYTYKYGIFNATSKVGKTSLFCPNGLKLLLSVCVYSTSPIKITIFEKCFSNAMLQESY